MVIHTGIKVNVLTWTFFPCIHITTAIRMPNAANAAPCTHTHVTKPATCWRAQGLPFCSGNCSPASCPRGKWPCRAALSNSPIYWEPKEHLSASSPCQPLSIAVGWPETPSPSRTPHHAPHTRPTVCRASTDCVSMLGHPVGKACQRLAQGTRKNNFELEVMLGYLSNKDNNMNQV